MNGALVVHPRSWYWDKYCLSSSLMIYKMAESASSEGLGGVVDNPDGFAAIHRYLDRLEKRAIKFTKGKGEALLLRKNNPILGVKVEG